MATRQDDLLLSYEVHPDREPWLASRRRSLGGSDTPKVAGVSSWGAPWTVYADKRGLVSDDAEAGEAAEWGRIFEPHVARRYARETGLAVEDPGPYTIVRNAAYPFLHATVDRYVWHPTRGRGILSIKTASAYKREDWRDEAPVAYQLQSQHEMLVTDLRWSAIAVLIGGQTFRYIDCIERDDAFCARLLVMLQRFWRAVETATPPPVDASEACRKALAELYPIDTGETIALPVELAQADADWLEAKTELERWQTQKNLAENRIRAALGVATVGVFPNGVSWSHKLQTRKSFVMPETSFRKLHRREGIA